ncbi:carbonic anhydrase [Chromatiales bacterium (ex Bugula neritina AB1)]|nr:carbonic anhydrase [Chromatiales bacterium (ex Bugula neritina AB1)]
MRRLQNLFDKNRQWSASVRAKEPEFFEKLSQQQAPEYLWIGCSDSRVPANQITDLQPGELFVHRNVANQVIHSDLNCLSVIQYAVDYLKVKHIIVCGHYGCGGVVEATKNSKLGMIDNWLRHVQDVKHKHEKALDRIANDQSLFNRMCELNVLEQVINVCQTTVVRDAWDRGQELAVHSWIYGLKDGLLSDLGMCVAAPGELESLYSESVASIVNKIPETTDTRLS